MPTSKQRISINLHETEYAQLAGMAERHGVSMAWVGRRALLEFMERYREQALQLPFHFPQQTEKSPWPNGETK